MEANRNCVNCVQIRRCEIPSLRRVCLISSFFYYYYYYYYYFYFYFYYYCYYM